MTFYKKKIKQLFLLILFLLQQELSFSAESSLPRKRSSQASQAAKKRRKRDLTYYERTELHKKLLRFTNEWCPHFKEDPSPYYPNYRLVLRHYKREVLYIDKILEKITKNSL